MIAFVMMSIVQMVASRQILGAYHYPLDHDHYVTLGKTKKLALLDSGSPNMIAGLDTLREQYPRLKFADGEKFPVRFGDGKPRQGIGRVFLPFGSMQLRVGVIPGKLPILFSKSALEATGAIVNFKAGGCQFASGDFVQLMDSGKHLCLPMDRFDTSSDTARTFVVGEEEPKDRIHELCEGYADAYALEMLDAIFGVYVGCEHIAETSGDGLCFFMTDKQPLDQEQVANALQIRKSLGHAGLDQMTDTLRAAKQQISKEVVKEALAQCGCPHGKIYAGTPKVNTTIARRFSEFISMDVVHFRGKSYLFTVDRFTGFCMLYKLKDQTSKAIFQAYLQWHWFFGAAENVITDAGTNFDSAEFERLCGEVGTFLKQHGNYAERKWQIVKHILLRLQNQHGDDVAIPLACVAASGVVSGGHSAHQRLMGFNPCWPTDWQNLPDEDANPTQTTIAAIHQAQSKIVEMRAKSIVAKATKTKPQKDVVYEKGDKIKFFRKQGQKFLGPAEVTDVQPGMLTVRIGKKSYSVAPRYAHKIEPVRNAPMTNREQMHETQQEHAQETAETGEIPFEGNDEDANYITIWKEKEFLATAQGREACQKEWHGLIDKEVGEEVPASSIPAGAQIVPIIWSHGVKDGGRFKSRACMRGDLEKFLENVAKDTPTLKRNTIRYLLHMAATHGLDIDLADVEMAFTQSDKIERELFCVIKNPLTGEKKYWRLLRPLYGLTDASRLLYMSMVKFLEARGFRRAVADRSFFYHPDRQVFIGPHIDDLMIVGNRVESARLIEEIRQRFKLGTIDKLAAGAEGKGDYCGMDIVRNRDSIACESRKEKELQEIESEDEYWTLLGKLLWVASATRPDISLEVSQLSSEIDLKAISKLVRAVQNRKSVTRFVSVPDARLVAFVDANHPTKSAQAAQLGMFFFMESPSGASNPISWSSNKSKLVCGSSTSAELIGIRLAMEESIAISMLIYECEQKPISLSIWQEDDKSRP